jgi:hypothetical protein
MNLTLSDIFNILLSALGLTFVILTVIDSRSLTGSFFKLYYRYMTGASVFLMLGFIIEPFADLIGLTGSASMMATHLHHTSLVFASVLFIYAGRILPKDAATYVSPQQ